MHVPSNNTCDFYRARLPLKHCKHPLAQAGIVLKGGPHCINPDLYDALIFHRVAVPAFVDTLQEMKSKGTRIVWDLDDDFFSIRSDNPVYHKVGDEEKKTLNTCLDLSDQIWVPTEGLRQALGRQEKTVVLPNLIDLDLWPETKPRDGCVRIVWAGSENHHADLELIEPAIEAILDHDIQVLFFGYLPTGLATFVRVPGENFARLEPKSRKVGYCFGVELADYPVALSHDIQPDIALAPLADCAFNAAKSPIKYWEYSLSGAATIASDIGPYKNINHFVDGLKAVRVEDWVDLIIRLIKHADVRNSLAANARQRVIAQHSWQTQKNVWVNAFKDLLS
jgi:glycosyltransferase involved in cell wall biosynthesis